MFKLVVGMMIFWLENIDLFCVDICYFWRFDLGGFWFGFGGLNGYGRVVNNELVRILNYINMCLIIWEMDKEKS